jgi:hypothetical protein
MGLADILSAERAAQDYKPNLGWRQYIAGGPGAGAAADVGRYRTASGEHEIPLGRPLSYYTSLWQQYLEGAPDYTNNWQKYQQENDSNYYTALQNARNGFSGREGGAQGLA